MFSCPLLISFLNDNDDSINDIKRKVNKVTWNKSVFTDLKKVFILGKKSSSSSNTFTVTETPYFYYGHANIKKTVDALKQKQLSYDSFMEKEITEVTASCKKMFSNQIDITKENVEKARSQIRNKKIKW